MCDIEKTIKQLTNLRDHCYEFATKGEGEDVWHDDVEAIDCVICMLGQYKVALTDTFALLEACIKEANNQLSPNKVASHAGYWAGRREALANALELVNQNFSFAKEKEDD